MNCVTRVVRSFSTTLVHFPPPPSERRAEGENMDEHGVNYIKATAVYLYDNGPLCAELHGCGFAIPVKKKVTVRK